MVRMIDVAKHAGVSVATVSNVITGKQSVSDKMRERVMASIHQLNYNVNLVARGLKTQRTYTIGVILPDVTKLFFLDVLKGIMETTDISGYKINIFSSNYDFETEKKLVHELKSSRVDGIILNSCVDRNNSIEWATELTIDTQAPTPIVSIESRIDAERISSVVVDCQYWSNRMTQHLIDIGCKKIFCLTGPIHIEHEYLRLVGYKQALKANHLKVDPTLIVHRDFSSGHAHNTIFKALNEEVQFDGIFCTNDQAAVGAIKALKEKGVSIPNEVAVSGFDDLFPGTLITPAVSTVTIPRYELGATAVKELLRRIDDKDSTPTQYILNASLNKRASTCADIKTSWDLENW